MHTRIEKKVFELKSKCDPGGYTELLEISSRVRTCSRATYLRNILAGPSARPVDTPAANGRWLLRSCVVAVAVPDNDIPTATQGVGELLAAYAPRVNLLSIVGVDAALLQDGKSVLCNLGPTDAQGG